MKKRIYFDNNANAPLDKDVLKLLKKAKDIYGNPSSLHFEGIQNYDLIEESREICAKALGCLPEELFFTSGASESNSWAHKIWELSHDSGVHDSLKGKRNMGDVIAVSFQNNETGMLDYTKYKNCEIFIDLTSAIGYNEINLHNLSNVLGASLSGHKIGALMGVGLLYVKLSEQHKMEQLIVGHQERGMRGGTENLLGIISLGIVLCKTTDKMNILNNYLHVNELGRYLYNNIMNLNYGIKISTNNQTTLLTFKHLSAQSAVLILNKEGISISAGSACNSGTDKPSSSLLNFGMTENEALRTIRISVGLQNTLKECKRFIKVITKVIEEYDIP